jgi:uncharacterized protein (TIGR02444 family)
MTAATLDTARDRSAFWDFSVRFYARPRVAAACLELQDGAGVDVNVLFYLLFLAQHSRQLDRGDVARIDAAVKTWREHVVLPLRTLRRELKNGITPIDVDASTSLRSDVKRIELAAERIEQHTLERLVPESTVGTPARSHVAAARANLAAYGEFLGSLPAAPAEILLEIFAAESI